MGGRGAPGSSAACSYTSSYEPWHQTPEVEYEVRELGDGEHLPLTLAGSPPSMPHQGPVKDSAGASTQGARGATPPTRCCQAQHSPLVKRGQAEEAGGATHPPTAAGRSMTTAAGTHWRRRSLAHHPLYSLLASSVPRYWMWLILRVGRMAMLESPFWPAWAASSCIVFNQ